MSLSKKGSACPNHTAASSLRQRRGSGGEATARPVVPREGRAPVPGKVAVAVSPSPCKNVKNGKGAACFPTSPHPPVPTCPAPWTPVSPRPCIPESLSPSHPGFLAATESHERVWTGRHGAHAGRQAWRVPPPQPPHGPGLHPLPRREGRGSANARPVPAAPDRVPISQRQICL